MTTLGSRADWSRRAIVVSALWLIITLPGCVFISANLNPFSRRPQPLEERVVSGEGDAKIVLIDVSSTISTTPERDPFGLRQRDSVT